MGTHCQRPQGEIALGPVDGDACRTLARGPWPCWSADQTHVPFRRQGKPLDGRDLVVVEVRSVGVDGKSEHKVADLTPMLPIDAVFDVSSRNQIAWPQFRPGKEELWMAALATVGAETIGIEGQPGLRPATRTVVSPSVLGPWFSLWLRDGHRSDGLPSAERQDPIGRRGERAEDALGSEH